MPKVDTSDQYHNRPYPGQQAPPGTGVGRFGFGRPGYARQRSAEWDTPMDDVSMKGKMKAVHGVQVALPSEPDEAALPLRSRSPRSPSPSVERKLSDLSDISQDGESPFSDREQV